MEMENLITVLITVIRGHLSLLDEEMEEEV